MKRTMVFFVLFGLLICAGTNLYADTVKMGYFMLPLIDNHRDVIKLQELGGDKWMEQNIEKLISGRLDGLFDRQQYTLPFVAATLNLGREITILPMPSPPKPMFVVFAKASKQGKALLDQYNASVPKTALNYKVLLNMEIESISK